MSSSSPLPSESPPESLSPPPMSPGSDYGLSIRVRNFIALVTFGLLAISVLTSVVLAWFDRTYEPSPLLMGIGATITTTTFGSTLIRRGPK